MKNLLIVDDNEDDLTTMDIAASRLPNVLVATAIGADDAFVRFEGGTPFDCIVTDINMGSGSVEGLLVIRRFKAAMPNCPIIAVTAFDDYDAEMERDVMALGASALERKKDLPHLIATIRTCLGI
jgi:CheY-like chemotaxis protein